MAAKFPMTDEQIANEFYENWKYENSCTAPTGFTQHALYIEASKEIQEEFQRRFDLETDLVKVEPSCAGYFDKL